ncbi:MAG: S8 family serine peptidase [Bacteroidota bacterium]|nr:S8 family serine peptidase [Bacteroidota bacterium]
MTAPSPSASPVIASDKTATHSAWSFLSLGATHADAFEHEHPTYDGRGVIIFIFDTGVDPGVAGLLTTSEGTHKVIDVHDFSGTGDVSFEEAIREGDVLRHGSASGVNVQPTTVLRGLNSISAKPADGKYYYASLSEKRFQNGLSDLNFNGKGTDNFGVLLFQDAVSTGGSGHWVAYVDSDGDGDLTGERQLTNYHERFDTFEFHSPDSVASSGKHLTGAVNIFPDRHLVSIYFDDGSHGTHVAGIAAGHDIDNEPGFNGVAPGAEISACKFADNNAGGVTVSGSMQQAFQLAAETATTQPKPVVVNMSFGIGNELEGSSVMDLWLDSLLAATPNLTVCISAGNEGPGLSSVGLPGSADRVITSGAALPDDAARDLYSIYINHPVLFDFSSRGGELAKPDIVSPGTAVSTVPDYVGGDRYNGTSMSSPYTAGCAAVLLSAMKQAFPDWQTNAFAIKRAMMLSAKHIEGALPPDEGYGMIDIPAAFELLSRWQKRGSMPLPVQVEAAIPSAIRSGTAAYFRAGNYPIDGDRESFTVFPEESSGAGVRQRALGMDAFDLVSDAAWMTPVESSIYRRGSGAMTVDVRYNAKLLQKPGLYSGRIWGYEKGHEHIRGEARFELWSTIAVPYTFSDDNQYRVTLRDIKMAPGEVEREFFKMPPGAVAAKVTLSTRDQNGACTARIFDNDGHEFSGLSLRRGSAQRSTTEYVTGRELQPGVMEIDLSRTMASEDEREMPVDLTFEVQPLSVTASASIDLDQLPVIRSVVANPSERTFSAQPDATVLGYERTFDTLISSSDSFVLPFAARAGERAVLFDVSLPAADYDLFTDITCQVLRPDSSAVFNSAFDYRRKLVPVNLSGSMSSTEAADADDSTLSGGEESSANGQASIGDRSAPYTLFIRGGLALPDRAHPWHLRIHEMRYLQNEQDLTSAPSMLRLSPYQSGELELRSEKPMMHPPKGYRFIGQIELKKNEQEEIRIPIEF